MPKTPSHRKKKLSRLIDIAGAAGVSLSTVDRVLNERETVSAAAREKVIKAARDMGARRLLPQTYRPLTHFDLILPKNESPFFVRLRAAFHDAAAMLDRSVIVHRLTLAEEDTAGFVRLINETPYPRRGMIIAVPDRQEIRASIARAQAGGQKVVMIVTDLPHLAGVDYLGTDNYRAGATAAYLLGQSCRSSAGRVVVLAAHHDWSGHVQRTAGFCATMERDFPHLGCEIIETDTRDDSIRCERAVRQAFTKGPLAGIYNAGAGSIGIMNALKDVSPRPCWIGHDISDDHIAYLRDHRMDYVIDQNPQGQALRSLQTLLYRCGLIETIPDLSPTELRIYTRENLPTLPPVAAMLPGSRG
ncbi:LacI family DNA-binding transcriptional regulator [Acidocella sp.]|uniref:LacI family DNA-binding transcriptional regulator n=1 Tax=Acidocella sp. TaxID=50710 RepID=UPI00262DD28F|nr:LacI family DNA-binding transcriptional regulator [Acidocella sp.]